jgi:hypothetical protein
VVGGYALAVSRLAFCGGKRWFSGERGVLEASASMRRPAMASDPPVAPVG